MSRRQSLLFPLSCSIACAAALFTATPRVASADGPGVAAVQPAALETPGSTGEARAASSTQWDDYSVEVYGMLVSRAGKTATLLPLVSTTATPVAAGTKAVLFRRIDDPDSSKRGKWVEIARVTMKKIEATGKMQLSIDSEAPTGEGQSGKKSTPFVKGARLKLAIE